MIPFRYDWQSGYWHGYHKGECYSIHPTNWDRVPYTEMGEQRLVQPAELGKTFVVRGLQIIPPGEHRT